MRPPFETNNQKFVTSIVSGDKCYDFGRMMYVKNSDTRASYTVTVKIVSHEPGVGSKEYQKEFSVAAGGKTYIGCTVSQAIGGAKYTYKVVGEVKG